MKRPAIFRKNLPSPRAEPSQPGPVAKPKTIGSGEIHAAIARLATAISQRTGSEKLCSWDCQRRRRTRPPANRDALASIQRPALSLSKGTLESPFTAMTSPPPDPEGICAHQIPVDVHGATVCG